MRQVNFELNKNHTIHNLFCVFVYIYIYLFFIYIFLYTQF